MKFQLTHFALFSPDEMLPYWFISHDFAEELKLDYSKEAAVALKRVVGPRSVKIDYETDVVILRISKKELVIPTLEAIYALLGWNAAELKTLEPEVNAFKRPRPRRISAGDIFHIPIAADLVGFGQILEINNKSPTVAVFTRMGLPSEIAPFEVPHSKLLTILHIGGNSLCKGDWPIVGSAAPIYDPASGPGGKDGEVGSRSFSGDGFVVELLEAYAGRRSWSEGFHDPQYLRKLVLP